MAAAADTGGQRTWRPLQGVYLISGHMNHCAVGMGKVLLFCMADREKKEPRDKSLRSLFSQSVPNHSVIR